MTRRVVVSTVLVMALVVSLGAWREATGQARTPIRELTITRTGVLLDAALTARPEILTARWVENRSVKTRPRLSLTALVGLSALLAVAMARLHWLWPAPRPTLSRRSGVILRAPPVLRLS